MVGRDLKVVSGAIKIKSIQDKPISSQYKPIQLVCALYKDSDEIVSNEIDLVLDSTSDYQPRELKKLFLI